MNMTPIYIGIGVGVTAVVAYALYKYFKSKEDPIDPDDSVEEVNNLDYQTLLSWLKVQSKQGIALPGDSFVILRSSAAKSCFEEDFPKKAKSLTNKKCLLVSVMKGETVKAAKFFIYDTLSSSLVDLLPKDEDTAYVQNLS